MDIIVQSPRIRISNRLESVMFEKFARFEEPSFRIIRCEVVLRKERNFTNNNFIVEARLILPGKDLFAGEAGTKFETAAENVCLDLEHQLRKRKTRLTPRAREKARAKKLVMSEEELE